MPDDIRTRVEKQNEPSIQDWTEYYLLNGYASKVDSTEFYASDYSKYQKVFVDKDKNKKYATKREAGEMIEYLPKDENGDFYYIQDDNKRKRLPRNITKDKHILPENYDESEYHIDASGYPIYKLDEDGNPLFCKNADGNPYYGKDSEGNEVYPKNNSGRNVYLRMGNVEIPARTKDGTFFYAKTENNDEFYPKTYDFKEGDEITLRDEYFVNPDIGIIIVK